MQQHTDIDDDRDVIEPADDAFLKSIDDAMERAAEKRAIELEAAADKEKVGVTVTVGTEHVQGAGWWQRTRKGATDFGARVRASWSWK